MRTKGREFVGATTADAAAAAGHDDALSIEQAGPKDRSITHAAVSSMTLRLAPTGRLPHW
jgi:hypothetical protein